MQTIWLLFLTAKIALLQRCYRIFRSFVWPSGYSKDKPLETLVSKSLSFATMSLAGDFPRPSSSKPDEYLHGRRDNDLSSTTKTAGPLSRGERRGGADDKR
jgi:hypothetical protein